MTASISLNEALRTIADEYGLDYNELLAYANEDEIGGYHSIEAFAKWGMGSLWAVDGKILYALVRALKPKTVIEIGSFLGCSSHHIAAALIANGSGKMTCVDLGFYFKVPDEFAGVMELVHADLFDYKLPLRRVDFLFEDAMHTTDQVAHVWKEFKTRAKKGAMIVSHDAAHFVVGNDVQKGIAEAGITNHQTMLVAPSDCGMALWRKGV